MPESLSDLTEAGTSGAADPTPPNKFGELIDAVAARGECDFVRDLAAPLPMYMVGERMGLPEKDHDQLLRWSDTFATGGDETTRHVMSGGPAALMRHRDPWAALRLDRSLLPGAVEEMLRWVTPIQNMNRTATRDVELGGQQIREGDRLLLPYPSGNRDERDFPDASRFDIRRHPDQHMAFDAR